MVSGSFGLVFLPAGQAVGWLAWLALSYLTVVVTWFAALPGVSLQIGNFPAPAIFIYYSAMALAIPAYRWRKRPLELLRPVAGFISRLPPKWVLPPLAVLALFPWLVFVSLPDNNVHVTFLDVGQGDAILIEKGNHQVLIDGGPAPQPVIVEMSKKMPFWDRKLDMVVLTHPDSDHLTGLVEVLKRYRVGAVISANLSDDSPLFVEWEKTVESKGNSIRKVFSGQDISIGEDVTLSVLNPSSDGVSSSDANNNCVVLRLDVGGVSFLLTVDLGTDGETELIADRAMLQANVLKVGHHGSSTSTGEAFLSVVDPSIAVISVGKDNNYGHPNQEVLARLTDRLGASSIYRTDELGSIEFITNGDRLWVKTEKGGETR
jgi:competence protein ComEC